MEEDADPVSGILFTKMPMKIDSAKVDYTDNEKEKKNKFKKWISENLLLLLTMAGVIAGVGVGFGLRIANLSDNAILVVSYPGELFMRVLKLLILPLIMSSLIVGSSSLNATMNGRIALRTLVYFFLTSAFNAALGVILAVTIHPGSVSLKQTFGNGLQRTKNTSVLDSFLDLGRNIMTDNIFQATFQQAHTAYVNVTSTIFDPKIGKYIEITKTVRDLSYRNGINTLGIVFFCLMFGTVLGSLGKQSKTVIEFFNVIFQAVMKMVTGVVWITPIGIVSIIAGKILSVSDIGLVLSQLSWFVGTIILGVYIYQLIVMQFLYFIFVRKNPFKFYLGLSQGTLTAFATASTAAALPITFGLMDQKLKVDTRITRFVLPIGCNINMDGTALFLAVSSIFIAQINGISLGMGELVTVWLTSTAASFSSASVPSAALVLLLMVLSAIDTPTQEVSLLFAIDWLVDRIRTTNNMLGDCYTAAIVEKLSTKELLAFAATGDGENLESLNSNSDTSPK